MRSSQRRLVGALCADRSVFSSAARSLRSRRDGIDVDPKPHFQDLLRRQLCGHHALRHAGAAVQKPSLPKVSKRNTCLPAAAFPDWCRFGFAPGGGPSADSAGGPAAELVSTLLQAARASSPSNAAIATATKRFGVRMHKLEFISAFPWREALLRIEPMLLLHIALVILLGTVKLRRARDLRDDGVLVAAALCQPIPRG